MAYDLPVGLSAHRKKPINVSLRALKPSWCAETFYVKRVSTRFTIPYTVLKHEILFNPALITASAWVLLVSLQILCICYTMRSSSAIFRSRSLQGQAAPHGISCHLFYNAVSI
jgi:hypothetical protein